MLRRLYIFALWMATLSVLLSSGVAHHHHAQQICFVEEQCSRDGNTNDSHTEHHDNPAEDCEIHQLHRFMGNTGVAQTIQRIIADGSSLTGLVPSAIDAAPLVAAGLTIVSARERILPLSTVQLHHDGRRGPPTLSFS